jgi:formylglycine-generating enzyme required for sulfatase activity
MVNKRKLRVFLCHSSSDKPRVRELYGQLITEGFDVWLDEEKLLPGQNWDLKIQKAVRESDVVVVCLSNSSTTKAGYVQKEIRFALDVAEEQPEDAIYIVPAKLENCQVPDRLTKWHWVNLFEPNGPHKLELSLKARASELGLEEMVNRRIIAKVGGAGTLRKLVEPQMIKIPEGKFLMGSTAEQAKEIIKEGHPHEYVKWEQPAHEVFVSEFFISRYPVTNSQYREFLLETKHRAPHGWQTNEYKYPLERRDHPVVGVFWEDAKYYCEWLSQRTGQNYRLPTEAEWEKAARGTDGRIYPWGENHKSIVNLANTSEANRNITTPVGQFSPNGDSFYGCADMAGNVWEWCLDWFLDQGYDITGEEIKDPQGPKTGIARLLRGGAFNFTHRYARCTLRYSVDPSYVNWDCGFRVVRSPIN